MADEQTAAPVAEDQTATDPRLEQTLDTPAAAPPEPAEAAEAPEGGEETPPAEAAPKPKKSAEEILKGRVGRLTKQLSAKDQAVAEAVARAEAAEALLAAGRTTEEPPAAGAPPVATPPAGGRTYTEAEFNAGVAARAAADTFNQNADAMYDAGAAKFADWTKSVDMLNATGLMGKDLLEAAMATDDGAAVIHHLGADVEEAQRITALPPIKMAAELTKLATKLAAPKSVPVSGAPAPIKGVSGAVVPAVDLEKAATGGNDMAAYAAARAKQGARWAQPKGARTA